MTLAQRPRDEGPEHGLQKGRREGLQEAILETLMIRFGAVPECLVAPIREVNEEARLRELHRAAIRAESIDEFERQI